MRTRLHAFAAAAFIYAGFSSPTPDAPGLAECLILMLLAYAAVPVRFVRVAWVASFLVFLGYGFTVPFVMGAVHGHAAGDILRDALAFGTLAVPVLFAHLFVNDDRAQTYLLATLTGVGLIFSLRYLEALISPMNVTAPDFLYLANSPLVTFSAAWLLLHGCYGEKHAGRGVALVVLSTVPIAAMIGMMQRATMALLILAWLGFFVATIVKRPQRAITIAIIAATLLILIWPLPSLVFVSFADKTSAVGWNARGAELSSLLAALNTNPLTAVLGAGWGSMFKSPAVGDLWVRFSHAFLTSVLWKTGWCGLVLGVVAIIGLIRAAWLRLRHEKIMFTALILPLLPALFLYGSYKSLCFGLLLLGLAALQRPKDGLNDTWTNPLHG